MRHCLFFRRGVLTAVLVAAMAGVAAAQAGRAGGFVKDETGQPIKGATVTAQNPEASPNSITVTSDDKGRFQMIGLKSGEWTFYCQAPGYSPEAGSMNIRQSTTTPFTFTLKRVILPPSALGMLAAKDIQAELLDADTLYNASKWDEAVAAYRLLLSKAPSLSVINLQIAGAYRNKGDFDKAITAYNDLLKVDPNNDKAKVGIAMTSLEKGDIEAAEKALQAAATAPGATREIFYNLGEVKFAKAKADEAFKAYERSAEVDPTWGKPVFAMGRVAMKQGDSASAIRYFQKVLDVDPYSPEAAQARTFLNQLKK
jgi:Flp pilus assembly protein TadD